MKTGGVVCVSFLMGLSATLVGCAATGGATKPQVALSKEELVLLDRLRADFTLIENALEAFRMERGRYPQRLDELWTPEAGAETGRYLEEEILDPWGRAYLYERRESGSPPYVIRTLGADGVRGGVGENADHTDLRLLRGETSSEGD